MIPNYAPLFHWVREREAIRVKKHAGAPQPWTADPTLAAWRFCNVRREDDRVTVWIRKRIREPFAGHPLLWLMLCIARQINWTPTLNALIVNDHIDAWPSSPHFCLIAMKEVMEELRADGVKIYTGAYTITAPRTKGTSKIAYTCETVIGQLWRDRQRFAMHFVWPHCTVAGTHKLLSGYEAWGGDGFMAYQAIGDMLFTPILAQAPDRDTWCAAGPGTIRGLNRLYGRRVDYRLPQEQARSEIRKLYAVIEKETGVPVAFNDVPNCLCETDKYLRIQNGEGTPRSKYTPSAEAWPE